VRLWACRGEDDPAPAPCVASPKALELVAGAELICFPMGSLLSSVVANLLPEGMGRAVAANPCPKVFIPNLGHDPETPGQSVKSLLGVLLRHLRRDAPPGDVLPVNFLLMDLASGHYPGPLDKRFILAHGVEIIDCPLVTPQSAPLLDPQKLAETLLSIA